MDTAAIAGVQAPQTGLAAATAVNETNGFLLPCAPNVIDFCWFLANSVQIPPAALPISSPWPQYALTQALGLVLRAPSGMAIQYVLAVYNCATHVLFSITPNASGSNFFGDARSNQGYSLINPSTGLVASSSDESTSASLTVPEWASRLTISDLDFMKTPWGRIFLSYNQAYGENIWGLT